MRKDFVKVLCLFCFVFGMAHADTLWNPSTMSYTIPADDITYYIDGTITLTMELTINGTFEVRGGGDLNAAFDIEITSGGIMRIEGEGGADGADAGANGANGQNAKITLSETIIVKSDGILTVTGGAGGNGGNGGISKGGDGGTGGTAWINGNGIVSVESEGTLELFGGLSGNGGRGGAPGTLTNRGGTGGTGGTAKIVQDIIITQASQGILNVTGGIGGIGGTGQIGGDDDSGNPGGPGGTGGPAILDGTLSVEDGGTLRATSGAGGRGGFAGGDNSVQAGGNGGDGGNATITITLVTIANGTTLHMISGRGGNGGFLPGFFVNGKGGGAGTAQLSINENFSVASGGNLNLTGGDGGTGGLGDGDGGDGGTSQVNGTGILSMSGGTLRLIGGNGADGGNFANGGNGGLARITSNALWFESNTSTMSMQGGNGGDQGASSQGGDGGGCEIDQATEKCFLTSVLSSPAVTVNPSNGQDGNSGKGGIAKGLKNLISAKQFDQPLCDPNLTLSQQLDIDFTWTITRDKNVWGNGYSIVLGPNGEIVIDQGATLHLDNLDLEGINDHNIRCIEDDSKLELKNVNWNQDADYTFTKGELKIDGECTIDGANTCFLLENIAQPVTIASNATLQLMPNVTLEYNTSPANLVVLTDGTSTLYLNNSQLLATQNLNLQTGVLSTEGLGILQGNPGALSVAGLSNIVVRGGLAKVGTIIW